MNQFFSSARCLLIELRSGNLKAGFQHLGLFAVFCPAEVTTAVRKIQVELINVYQRYILFSAAPFKVSQQTQPQHPNSTGPECNRTLICIFLQHVLNHTKCLL